MTEIRKAIMFGNALSIAHSRNTSIAKFAWINERIDFYGITKHHFALMVVFANGQTEVFN